MIDNATNEKVAQDDSKACNAFFGLDE